MPLCTVGGPFKQERRVPAGSVVPPTGRDMLGCRVRAPRVAQRPEGGRLTAITFHAMTTRTCSSEQMRTDRKETKDQLGPNNAVINWGPTMQHI